MKRNILLTALICTGMMLSCSSGTVKQKTESHEVQAEPVENKVNPADYVRPASEGIFIQRDKKLEELNAGMLEDLMQTNAERGFGFGNPIGMVLEKSAQKLSILQPLLNVGQLQITSFRGIAVNSEHWFDPVDDTNVAWIPENNVAINLQVIDSDSGFAEIQLDKPLEPGFYVIHDDSFLRARVADDVSAYYPFVVLSSPNKSLWEAEADKCFAPFLEKYAEVIPLDNIEDLDTKSLKKCENVQRIAWKFARSDEDAARQFKARTLYMNRLFDSGDIDAHRAMIETMDPSKDGLLQKLWLIDQNDLVQRLARLQILADAGGDLPPRLVQAVVDSIQNQKLRNTAEDFELSSDPVSLISWIPFARCSSDDPALMALMDALLNHKSSDKLLVELVGAVHYQQLFSKIQKNTGFASWFKQIEPNVPMSFKSRAASLSFRKDSSRVIVGPCQFTGVLPSEQSSWCATLKAKEKDIKSCIPANYSGPGCIMILEQPLNGSMPGRDVKGVLRDPLDTQRKTPAVSPEIADCILNAFAKIPASPSLDVTQTAKVAVTIVGD